MVYLEVIYVTKKERTHERYELKDYVKAFNKWWRFGGVIWLRETKYDHDSYFDMNTAKRYFIVKNAYVYAGKQDFFERFVEWLKDQLELWNDGEGLELIK